MTRTTTPDRVSIVDGGASTASKAVLAECVAADYALDLQAFPVGALVAMQAQYSYDGGLTWVNGGSCSIKTPNPADQGQDRPSDGLTRFFVSSNNLRGRVGVLNRAAFDASLRGAPLNRGFDLVTGFDDVQRVQMAVVK